MAWDYAPCSKARDQVKECHKDQRREPENDTYHASIIAIPTLHLLAHLKPHALIDLHIGHTLRTFQITLDPLPIRPLRDSLEQKPADPAPLRLGTHSNNIAKVVPTRIIPDLRLRFLLPLLPDPVPIRTQTPAPEVADIGQELIER